MPTRQMKVQLLTLAVASALASGSALATNGYAMHGVGIHAKGMGGASIALPQDAVSIGQNPAASAVIGNRVDVGLDIFRPIRDAELSATGLNPCPAPGFCPPPGFSNGKFDGSESEWFFIPEAAYNRVIDSKWSAGVSLYGNGGMNTDYGDGGIPLFNAGTRADTGINLQQMFIVPTFAYKIDDKNSVGFGANIVAQGFKAFGLQSFAGQPLPFPGVPYFSTSPSDVTDNGTDWAWGLGFRVGWLGQVSDTVTLGAYYSSQTWMQKFDDYKGLFSDSGAFDIPQNFGVGIAVKATPQLTIAADVMYIDYASIDSIANPIRNFYNCPALMGSNPNACLGGKDGPGFGWDSQTVFKLGVQYEIDKEWTVRAGWNYGSSVIPESQTMFNVLAPATVQNHLSLGASWNLAKDQELTFQYTHAFEKQIDGDFTPGFGTADIKMYQDSFGMQYSWKM